MVMTIDRVFFQLADCSCVAGGQDQFFPHVPRPISDHPMAALRDLYWTVLELGLLPGRYHRHAILY